MAFGAGQGFEQVALPLGEGQGEIDRRTGAALTSTHTLWLQRRSVSCLTTKETLENPAHLRENRPVIAGMDWVDGKQAAWLR
jgi:hypothetical protein